MRKLGITLLACIVALLGSLPVAAAFKDVKIDLNSLLTNDEKVEGTLLSFGVLVADDGSVSRVADDNASANGVVSGVFHDNDHGWTNSQMVLHVDGPVKVGVGNCTYGSHDATITDEAENVINITTLAQCYKNDGSVSYGYYTGGATTLTIKGAGYNRYFSVEAVVEDIQEATVSYSLGSVEAVGLLPISETVVIGEEITIPINTTLYAEGKTLTGWTDGTTTYAIGETIAPTKDMTLNPVFTENTVTIAERTEPVTVKWNFRRDQGATAIGIEGNAGICVTQVAINGITIDVKMDIDAINGKFNNAGHTDWSQVNSGTIFTIPTCKNAIVSFESYNATTTTTIAGDVINQGTKTPSYTYAGTANAIDIVIGDGSYYRYIQVVLPANVLCVEDGKDLMASGTFEKATYSRTVNPQYNYGTICLPFAPDAETLGNYTFYELGQSTSSVVTFVEVENPQANMPYLYSAVDKEAETHTFTGEETTVVNETNLTSAGNWAIKGVFAEEVVSAIGGISYYAYSPLNTANQSRPQEDVLVKVTNSLTVKPYRAYFMCQEQMGSMEPLATVRIVVRGQGDNGDGTTAIEEVITPDQIEGAVAPAIYDLMGRSVQNPMKGQIYIVNGQKVVF